MPVYEMEATYLRDGRYAVRPQGQLGTCGFSPVPWTVVYVKARNEADAVAKADRELSRIAAVNKEIAKDKRISPTEAKAIHALLRGRH